MSKMGKSEPRSAFAAMATNDQNDNPFRIKVMGEINSYLRYVHIDIQNEHGNNTGITPIRIDYVDDIDHACRFYNPVFANLVCAMLNLTVGTDKMHSVTHCVIPSAMIIKRPVELPKIGEEQ